MLAVGFFLDGPELLLSPVCTMSVHSATHFFSDCEEINYIYVAALDSVFFTFDQPRFKSCILNQKSKGVNADITC